MRVKCGRVYNGIIVYSLIDLLILWIASLDGWVENLWSVALLGIFVLGICLVVRLATSAICEVDIADERIKCINIFGREKEYFWSDILAIGFPIEDTFDTLIKFEISKEEPFFISKNCPVIDEVLIIAKKHDVLIVRTKLP